MEKKDSHIYKYKYLNISEYSEVKDSFVKYRLDMSNNIKKENKLWLFTLAVSGLYFGISVPLLLLNNNKKDIYSINVIIIAILALITIGLLAVIIYKSVFSIKSRHLNNIINKEQDKQKQFEFLYNNISEQIPKKVKIPKNPIQITNNKNIICESSLKYIFPVIFYNFYNKNKIDIITDILIPLNVFKLYHDKERFNKLLLYYCLDIAKISEYYNIDKVYYEEVLSEFYNEELYIINEGIKIEYLSDNKDLRDFHLLSLRLLH